MEPIVAMEHGHAVASSAAERFLLDELTLDERDAFEAHVFDCQECAMDLRAAAAFMDEAREQLPGLVAAGAASARAGGPIAPRRSSFWEFWSFVTRPAFAAPVFAALLLVIGFQNLITLPGLRSKLDSPQLMAWAPAHGATRGAAIAVDRAHGVALPIDVSGPGALGSSIAYATYSFDLIDPQGKTVWTGSMPAPASLDGGAQRVLLAVPGAMVAGGGAYAVAVTGIEPGGEHTELGRQVFNLSVK